MITKAEARRRLLHFFRSSDIEAWLANFPECHTWRDEDFFGQFIDYINRRSKND